jgi:hypothetical protein
VRTIGDSIKAALAKNGTCITVRATATRAPRSLVLAATCEAPEAERTWEPWWDQCPYRVIGYGHLGGQR